MGVVLMSITAHAGYELSVTADELWQARQWVSAKFLDHAQLEPPRARVIVVENNDPVQQNGRVGKPLKIGKEKFWRGLFCHAVSKLVVRLPAPGQTFRAQVGVDSNSQTSGGRGSVRFLVGVGGRCVFRSPVIREGMGVSPGRARCDTL